MAQDNYEELFPGVNFGEEKKVEEPKPENAALEFDEEHIRNPHVERPFRGVISKETQDAFTAWLPEGLPATHPDYLMAVKKTSWLYVNREYFGEVIDPKSQYKEPFSRVGRIMLTKSIRGFKLGEVEVLNETMGLASPEAMNALAVQYYKQHPFNNDLKEDAGPDRTVEELLEQEYKDDSTQKLSFAEGTVLGTFSLWGHAYTHVTYWDGKFRNFIFRSKSNFAVIRAWGDESVIGEVQVEESEDGHTRYEMEFDGEIHRMKRYVDGKLIDDLSFPEEVALKEVQDRLIPPEILFDPVNAHPEYDKMWMNMPLYEALGIEWRRPSEGKKVKTREEALKLLEDN